jgi:hypothetical protein
MRKYWLVLATVAILALAAVGCGGSDDGAADETPAADTTTTEAPAGDTWTTVTTLHSDDPQENEGILISEPFTASGDARFVVDMPDAGDVDGVIGTVIPEDQAGDPMAILKALKNIPEEQNLTLMPSLGGETVVPGLDGSYVLVVNYGPDQKAWSVEIQTQQ